MIVNIYSVLDRKASAFLPIFHARTDGEAMRMMRMTMMRGPSQFTDFPDDYHIYLLGEFDDATGEIQPQIKPLPVASISELLEEHKRQVPTQSAADLQVPDFKFNSISETAVDPDQDLHLS